MYTVFSKPAETRGDWFLVDAAGKTLGRLASEIAHRLKGKHKPNYAPHQDLGDHIVVVNAGAVRVTGAKLTGQVLSPAHRLRRKFEEHCARQIAQGASRARARVRREGDAAEGPLGRRMYRKLHVFGGSEHPHQAQQPKALQI